MKNLRSLFFFWSCIGFGGSIHAQTISRIESVQSLYIELFKDNNFLGSATGFVIRSKTQNYLITNWHVVTNKNPSTKNWIDSKLPVSPNKVAIIHNAKELGKYTVRTEQLEI